MDIQLIKRIEKPILPKVELSQIPLKAETFDIQEPVIERKPLVDINFQETNHIPMRENPLIQSVGNSGWQVSEIWRDLRIDNFYD